MTIASTIAVGLHAFDAEIVDLQNGVLGLLAAFVNSILSIANGGTNSGTALSGSGIMVSNGTQIVQGAAGTVTTLLHGNAVGAPSYAGVSLTADTTANQGTTTTLLHGNAAGQPSFAAVTLTTDVTGTLPIGNGGTGNTTGQPSGTAGGDLTGTYPSPTLVAAGSAGTNTKVTTDSKGRVTALAAATLASADFANQGTTTTVLHGNAAGNPSFAGVSLTADTSANQGTTTTVLHGNAAGQPSFGAIVNADISTVDASKITTGTLAVARGGTNSTATPTNGGAAYGDGSAHQFTAAGSSGQVLQSAGAAAPVWAGETTWTAPTLAGTWANTGGALMTAGYLKDPNGFVHLRGTVTGGGAVTIFTLATGYRPSAKVIFATYHNGAFGDVTIQSDGTVTNDTGGNTNVALDGISFDTR